MKLFLLVLFVPLVAACNRNPPTEQVLSGAATTTGPGFRPWHEVVPETPEDVKDKEKTTKLLVGRWLVDHWDELAPGFHPGYDFKEDGTFVVLTQKGTNETKGGGKWMIRRSRFSSGRFSLSGESAPPLDEFDFEYKSDLDALFLIAPHSVPGKRAYSMIYRRRK